MVNNIKKTDIINVNTLERGVLKQELLNHNFMIITTLPAIILTSEQNLASKYLSACEFYFY